MKVNLRKWIAGLLCLLLIVGNITFAGAQITYSAAATDVMGIDDKAAGEESLPEDAQALQGEDLNQEADAVEGETNQQITDIPSDAESVEDTKENQEMVTDVPTATPAADVTEITEVTNEPTEEDVEQLDADEEAEDSLEGRKLITHEALNLDLDDISTGSRASVSDIQYNANAIGLVTTPKDQGLFGTCWAFSATSLAETSLIKKGISVQGTISNKTNTDLSELHVAYFFANKPADPLGNTTGDKVTIAGDDYKDAGGNLYLQAFSYANGVGAVSESVLSYSDIASLNQGNSKAGLAYRHPAAMKNAYFINNTKKQIKTAVLKYGSVGMSYYHISASKYYNSATSAYCYPKSTTSVNHSVAIVGWNDNYSTSNFKSDSKVTQKGAWIVKNSWGTGWGDGGYMYISYQDGSINDAIAMEFQDGAKYDYNYQYDGAPGPMAAMVGNGGKIANVYQVKGNGSGNEILKAVSFALNNAQIDYSIQIYVDIQNRKDPTSGTKALKTEITGKTAYAGIYTVDMGTDISLSRGTYYSIVITLTGKSEIEHFVESSYNLGWVSGTAKTAAKQSFANWDGSKGGWTDLNGGKICARIKGFTVNDPEKPLASTMQKVTTGGYNSNKLTWAKTAGAVGYEIYRSTSSSSGFAKIATVTNGATVTYTDKGLAFNTTYYYKIRSYKKSSGGQVSLKVKGYYSKVLGSKTRLATPAVSKVASAGYNKIKVTWNKISGAQGYQLVRSTRKSGTYTTVANITAGSTVAYTDKGRTTGKNYYYKVRPYRTAGKTKVYGSYSAAMAGTAKLSKTNFTALNNKTAARMKLTWKQVSGAGGYEVYRKKEASGTYKNVKTIKGGSILTFTNEKLQSGTYYYKVRAYRTVSGKKIYGAFSAEKYAKLKEIPAKKLKLNKTSEKVTLMPTVIILSESTIEMAQDTTYDLRAVLSTYEKKQI